VVNFAKAVEEEQLKTMRLWQTNLLKRHPLSV